MKKIFIILLIFIQSCGYQPIFVIKNPENAKFNKIYQKGNEKINKIIIKELSIIEDSSNKSLDEIVFLSSINIVETSKNTQGRASSFRMEIFVELVISNSNKIIASKKFYEQFTYNNKKNKFELVQYQNQIENNLLKEIIKNINLFLNLI